MSAGHSASIFEVQEAQDWADDGSRKTGLMMEAERLSQNAVKCLIIDMAKIPEHLEDCGKWKVI